MKQNKKGQLSVYSGVLITLILAVIIGGISMSYIQTQLKTTTIEGDIFTALNDTCVRVTSNCISSTTSVINSTSAADVTGNFSLCAVSTSRSGTYDGYLLSPDSTLDSYDGGTVNASYSERSCNYVSGIAGTILGYIPVILALALFAFLAFYAIKK